jgi:hypothetical protein
MPWFPHKPASSSIQCEASTVAHAQGSRRPILGALLCFHVRYPGVTGHKSSLLTSRIRVASSWPRIERDHGPAFRRPMASWLPSITFAGPLSLSARPRRIHTRSNHCLLPSFLPAVAIPVVSAADPLSGHPLSLCIFLFFIHILRPRLSVRPFPPKYFGASHM